MVLPWRRRHYRLHIWLQHLSLQNCKHPWPAVCSMLWCLPSSTPNKRSGQYKLNNSQHTSGPLSAITVGDIMILFSFSPPTLLPVAFYWDLLLLFFFFFFWRHLKGVCLVQLIFLPWPHIHIVLIWPYLRSPQLKTIYYYYHTYKTKCKEHCSNQLHCPLPSTSLSEGHSCAPVPC